jgi:hypothetical protein
VEAAAQQQADEADRETHRGRLAAAFDDGKRTGEDGNRHNGDLVIAQRTLQGVGAP